MDWRIPMLPPTRSFASDNKLIIYKPNEDKTFRIDVVDLGLHLPNRDYGTVNETFEIQYQSQNQNPDGRTVHIFGGQQGGRRAAIAYSWSQGIGNDYFKFEQCTNYTGTNADV